MQNEATMVGKGQDGGGGVTKYSQYQVRHDRPILRQKQEALNQKQSQIGTLSHFLAGGIAGAVRKTCTAPLARLTILFQDHYTLNFLQMTWLWLLNKYAMWPFMEIKVGTAVNRKGVHIREMFRALVLFLQALPGLDKHRDNKSADICVKLLGGGLAGITSASITYPLDLVRTRLAAQ